MKRPIALVLVLVLVPSGLAAAAAVPSAELPPPDLVPLLRLAAPPLEKPPVELRELALPASPQEIPPLPVPPLKVDILRHPLPPIPPPGSFVCNPIANLFRGAAERLECGRRRFQAGELDEARRVLDEAVKTAIDQDVIREARYWLGETLFRLNRLQDAERNLAWAQRDSPASDVGMYALHSLGWLALLGNDPARALERFDQLLKSGRSAAPELIFYATHGRAMALFTLGRYPEARSVWQNLAARMLPAPLAREVSFWLGETLGRTGEFAAASDSLRRFTGAGPHPLLETGILRLGWWELEAGDIKESASAFRRLLSISRSTDERAWALVGLTRADVASGDLPGAREEVRQLQAGDASHPLLLPALLFLLRASVDKGQFPLARTLQEQVLASNPPPPVRSYVLVLAGEVSRREGQSGEARGQFELARSTDPGSPYAWRATIRLVQLDLEAREFGRAQTEIEALMAQRLTAELRVAALLLSGEAAYWAKSYEAAAEAFGRFISEFPGHPDAGSAALSLAWTEFRLGRRDAARQRWLEFARSFPQDPRAAEALLLAAELAATAGDGRTARNLLDQFLSRFPAHPDAAVARLNRAILELREGQSRPALAGLRQLAASAPSSPFIGRIRVAMGVALLASGEPGEAAAEFSEALKQGEDVVGSLGLGNSALAQGQWEPAERHFLEARGLAAEPARTLAEYGAAVAMLKQGKREEFARAATALAQSPHATAVAPRLVYVLAAMAVEGKRWSEARQWTLRLANDFPDGQFAAGALARLGAAAFAEKAWPLARESYELLVKRYPKSPYAEEARLDLGEALIRTGAVAEARATLEPVMGGPAGDPRRPRALLLLAQAYEAGGDRARAIEALERLVGEYPGSEFAASAQIALGRLLQEAGRWEDSRRVLEKLQTEGDEQTRVEAAFRLGETYRTQGLHEDAAEAYMTAAYLGPQSKWGRRALLAAGQSFVTLKDARSAAIVYRKLVAQPNVEPELTDEARKALQQLGQRP